MRTSKHLLYSITMFYTFSHIDNKLFSKLPDFSVILLGVSTTITSIEYV
jgi:hypothetical protein